ncbi:cyclic pyranopterin monophosphate synthase MoaC [Fulvivirga sedimenti]|uniref:cyclic pyranopterin monophosphate synthase n=1 Tax=Fulvivirga sedimenti TaxID=2879465 RepID=A0A9X1HKG5_9BACT|nr:cyclic pyranopterin monophosphate synthase MoaC [Fulvivirga sedimenti]MCA6073491.1 cyclic pyranopterin monophosphate synthase MoaC [Fulvivirga sedimenti]
MKQEFSHLSAEGDPRMVDVSEKAVTARTAVAQTIVVLDEAIMDRLENDEIHTKKGPVFQTAILAGIMGAKRTSDLIPLCHPIGLDNCEVNIVVNERREVVITCTARVTGRTGVEMEALTGASVAALTIYDMCKGFSHEIEIRETKLLKKTGGKRDFKRA